MSVQLPTCLGMHLDDKEFKTQGCCYQDHEKEIWVRMRNIRRTFYKEVTSFRQWEEQAPAAKHSAISTSEEQSEILLCFYDTYTYLSLYTLESISFLYLQPHTERCYS